LQKVLQVAQEASGWIRFALTTISLHRLICGDALFVEVSPADATVAADYAVTTTTTVFFAICNEFTGTARIV